MYGHYELQPNDVNGRPYFKMGLYGLWWDGTDSWWFGDDISKGQAFGFAWYQKDVFCPHQLTEWEWFQNNGVEWSTEWLLGITCKCIFI